MTPLEKIEIIFAELKSNPVEHAKPFFSELFALMPAISAEDRNKQVEIIGQYLNEQAEQYPINAAYGACLVSLVYFFKEDYESLFPVAFDALQFFTERDINEGAAIVCGFIGAAYRTLGDFDGGLKYIMRARKLLEESSSFQFTFLGALYQNAGIYYDMHHYKEALEIYLLAHNKAQEISNSIWIVYTLNGIGLSYFKLKRYDEAKEYLEKAVAESKVRGTQHTTSKALTDLGTYYFETEEYKLAEDLQLQALAIREEINGLGGAITNFAELAEIKLKENDFAAALSYTEKALKIAEQIKVKPKIYLMHLLLSKIYHQNGEHERSLEHYKIYSSIKDEVEKEDAEKKIKNLQLVFEAEQIQKENIIIKKQKAEIEQKNIELQDTIDELTRTKVGKKAKALTLIIAIILFVAEEMILHTVMHLIPEENLIMSMGVKAAIILSLKPIDSAIEHYMLHKLIRKKKREIVVS